MSRTVKLIAGGLLIVGALVAATIYLYWDESVKLVAMGINYVRYIGAPAGTISIEVAAKSKQPAPIRRATTRR
jgi:alcohol dehydrogenase (cytochrome c)